MTFEQWWKRQHPDIDLYENRYEWDIRKSCARAAWEAGQNNVPMTGTKPELRKNIRRILDNLAGKERD